MPPDVTQTTADENETTLCKAEERQYVSQEMEQTGSYEYAAAIQLACAGGRPRSLVNSKPAM